MTDGSQLMQDRADNRSLQDSIFRRSLWIVVISQIFGGAGISAGVTVGALLAQDMLGTDSGAGVPSALLTLGSALSALLIGRMSQRFGRRKGLASGFIVGGFGAIGVILAAQYELLSLLFLSLLLYGAGTAANLQARYAGTDLAKPTQRAKAVSISMVSTTFGAVAGPNLVHVTGDVAEQLGLPALSGLFVLAAAAFLLAGIVLLIFLRPDPLLFAKRMLDQSQPNQSSQIDVEAARGSQKGLVVGTTVMVLTQIVMVAVMTMTPIHMMHHGHTFGDVGLVIGIHIGAMYFPSLITGILVDKIGRVAMSIASGAVLLLAGVVAATAPGDSMALLITALALLGLGWNLGLISGTAMVVDATVPANRAKKQGSIDVLVGLSGASGGALSGMVVAHSSYAALSLAGGALALLLIPVVIWSRRAS
ncbi:putative MFS-type transporter YdeG [Paenibacillus sp. CCS19]|uniref:MFS transporter n=1 Tax=Paenibacillus sp. CCS19 TaxID=3158387 RepID=UPI00256BAE9B|nr:putative MFS-type transporter YdeG [Paenibacillus cellulosilyticus]